MILLINVNVISTQIISKISARYLTWLSMCFVLYRNVQLPECFSFCWIIFKDQYHKVIGKFESGPRVESVCRDHNLEFEARPTTKRNRLEQMRGEKERWFIWNLVCEKIRIVVETINGKCQLIICPPCMPFIAMWLQLSLWQANLQRLRQLLLRNIGF